MPARWAFATKPKDALRGGERESCGSRAEKRPALKACPTRAQELELWLRSRLRRSLRLSDRLRGGGLRLWLRAGGRLRRWSLRGRMRCRRGGGRRRRRDGGGDAGYVGAEAEALEAAGVELAGGVETLRGLKLLQRGDGARVPLAVGIAGVIAIARERGLDFGDAIGRRSLLRRLARGRVMMFCRFLFGRRLLRGRGGRGT